MVPKIFRKKPPSYDWVELMKKPDFLLCLYGSIDDCLDQRPVSMATVCVQANCRACISDVDEFKGPGSMSMMSMITVPLLYL